MKIVMLCDFFDEKLQYQENLLAKYYTKHGHSVVIISSTYNSAFDYYAEKSNKKEHQRHYSYEGYKIYKQKYSLNIFYKLRKLSKVPYILNSEKPDLIFVHDIHLNIFDATNYIKVNPNCKMIMDYHADYSNSANNWLSINFLHKIIRKKLILSRNKKYISKIFPVVPTSAQFLNELYDIPYEDMEILPLGSDTDLSMEVMSKSYGLEIRKKLEISKDSFVIFTGGKFNPVKKTELLIDAFHQLNVSDIHLIIVGDASEENKDYKELLLSKINGNVKIHFLGWQSNFDMYKYLNASDLAVFPQSQSVLWQQAISMELPLIVGVLPGSNVDYLNKYNNIIILNKQDITSENIAYNIKLLLDNKSRLADMKMGAKKITNELLNWNNLILKTLNL